MADLLAPGMNRGILGDPKRRQALFDLLPILGSQLMAAGAPSTDPGASGRALAQIGPMMQQRAAARRQEAMQAKQMKMQQEAFLLKKQQAQQAMAAQEAAQKRAAALRNAYAGMYGNRAGGGMAAAGGGIMGGASVADLGGAEAPPPNPYGLAPGIGENLPDDALVDVVTKGKEKDQPMSVREWEYYSSLPPKKQEEYLRMKRAQKFINLGDRYVAPNPSDPTQVGAQYGVGIPPERIVTDGQVAVLPPVPGVQPGFGAAGGGAPTGPQITELPPTRVERRQMETAEREETDRARQQGVAAATDVGKAGTMLETINSLRDAINSATAPAVGTASQPFALLSSTAAGRVRSLVEPLQSGVALGAMKRLKDASASGATGFGAMNEKELGLLISDIGALNPDTTAPDIFLKTLDRIEGQYKRVAADVRRNVSPERIAELGLEPMLQMIEGDSGGQPSGDWGIRRTN